MSTLSMGSSRIWLNSSDPGVSEPDVDQGNLWLNTAEGALIANIDPTVGSQVWSQVAQGTIFQFDVSGIDGTALGATTIFTTNAGSKNFYPSLLLVRLTSVAGVVAGGLQVSFGFNNPTYDNILSATGVPLILQNDFVSGFQTAFTVLPGTPISTDFKINVAVAEATATTYTLSATVIGNYL